MNSLARLFKLQRTITKIKPRIKPSTQSAKRRNFSSSTVPKKDSWVTYFTECKESVFPYMRKVDYRIRIDSQIRKAVYDYYKILCKILSVVQTDSNAQTKHLEENLVIYRDLLLKISQFDPLPNASKDADLMELFDNVSYELICINSEIRQQIDNLSDDKLKQTLKINLTIAFDHLSVLERKFYRHNLIKTELSFYD
jgi:hypothetical protein